MRFIEPSGRVGVKRERATNRAEAAGGDGQGGDVTAVDVATLSPRRRYRLLTGLVVPRPVGLVSTISRDGVRNVAPFSFFNAVCSTPMMVSVSVNVDADRRLKDTLCNIRETGEFVVHPVTESILPQANKASGAFPPSVDEFDVAGLTPVASRAVRPFRVREAPVQMECRLHGTVHLGGGPGAGSLVIGRVVVLHVAKRILGANDRVDLDELRPVARLSGPRFARLGEMIELKHSAVRNGGPA